MIRVAICDDHPLVRRGLAQVLTDDGDIEVVVEAGDYSDLAGKMRETTCDVLLVDVLMPGKNGIEVVKIMRERYPKLPVLVLSMFSQEQYGLRALKAGAAGYLTKDAAPEKLIDAVRMLARGKKYITPELAEMLADRLDDDPSRPAHEVLSDREFETLRLIAAGVKLSDIAEQLCLSPKTVSVYRARVMEKLGLKSTAEMVQYAMQQGIIEG